MIHKSTVVTTIERIDLSVGSLLSVIYSITIIIKCESDIHKFKNLTKLPKLTKASAPCTKIEMNMVVDTNIKLRQLQPNAESPNFSFEPSFSIFMKKIAWVLAIMFDNIAKSNVPYSIFLTRTQCLYSWKCVKSPSVMKNCTPKIAKELTT